MKTANLLHEQKWWGEFFPAENRDERFIGEITYSPEHGISLNYVIATFSYPEVELLHGILSTGQPCTLVGKFKPNNLGFSVKNGVHTRIGKVGFQYLVVGGFISKAEKFKSANFSLSNLQEFFFPKGRSDLIKYSNTPLLSVPTPFGELEVRNNASFGFIHPDITGAIYSSNAEALKTLQESFAKINNQFPDANFMFKKEIAYRIKLNIDHGLCIDSITKKVDQLSDLFSLLIFNPVIPESINVTQAINDQNYNLEIYPSMLIQKSTLEDCATEKSHFSLPITYSKLNLSKILSEWLNKSESFKALTTSIQSETYRRSAHTAHGEFVLYATQLEAISHSESVKKDKYEYPITKYATPRIKNQIESILNKAGIKKLGEGIGIIRNEIAHVGRKKKISDKLVLRDIITISHYLQLTIAGYALSNLGVDRETVNSYQNHLCYD